MPHYSPGLNGLYNLQFVDIMSFIDLGLIVVCGRKFRPQTIQLT